jgi:hypothetical protein
LALSAHTENEEFHPKESRPRWSNFAGSLGWSILETGKEKLNPAAEMQRLKTIGLTRTSKPEQGLLPSQDFSGFLWRQRDISSHRGKIFLPYIFFRRWIYREVCLSVQDAIREQEQINGKVRSALRYLAREVFQRSDARKGLEKNP